MGVQFLFFLCGEGLHKRVSTEGENIVKLHPIEASA